jgi:hypothetical protein
VATPTAITAFVDREEYSRFERDRNTVRVTIDPAGTNLTGEQLTIKLMKARRNRDVSAAVETVTLDNGEPFVHEFKLAEIMDEGACPTIRNDS